MISDHRLSSGCVFSLYWWHHRVGHFGGRTKGVSGLPRPRQQQIQPTHQHRQDKVMASDSVLHTHSKWTTGTGGYVPIPWVPDYRRWWVYDRIPYQVKQRAGDRASLQEIRKSHSSPISIKIWLMKALVWPVAAYSCKSWTLKQNEEETRLNVMDSKENKWMGS